ncbi:Sodium/hydrogen exchanger [Phellopilus nigrolimitatus]|nr:Sodium/hydrogen exchanger [Phellopilus nigrolimitatus]
MVSLFVKEKLYIGEAVFGTGFGVIIGPHCANVFDPRSWGMTLEEQNKITLEVMRVVLATGLFAIGVELPTAYLTKHAVSLLVMVVPTMAFGWLVSAGIIHALFPALTFISSLAISACLTPTDPVLSAAIIGGTFSIENVPNHIRHILRSDFRILPESAANDGLAYPFLSISIYLAVETSKREAFGKWFLVGWLCFAFSFLMKASYHKGIIGRESFVVQYLAFAILTIGIASTIGTDDLLASFAAGCAISWDGHFNIRTEQETFSSVIDLFNATDIGIEPWRLVVLFLAIVVLRRIPSLLAFWREALFCGHFGPMGVGAIFISTLALTELPIPSDPPTSQNELLAATMHPIVSFVVLCSILIRELYLHF